MCSLEKEVPNQEGEVTKKTFVFRLLQWIPGKDATNVSAEASCSVVASAGEYLSKVQNATSGN